MHEAYEKLGPSWDLVSEQVVDRKPEECRRMYNQLNRPTHITNSTEMKAHLEGLERHGGLWIDVAIEKTGSRNAQYLSLLDDIPFVQTCTEQKRLGWHPTEDMVIREAFDHYGPNWESIAERLRHRTPTQCKNRMIELYRSINLKKIGADQCKE